MTSVLRGTDPRVRSALALAATAWLGAQALGCDDVERFSTAAGESYCGAITLAGEFRLGLSPLVQMRLKLDASALDGTDSPGTIATYEAADGANPARRLFVDAKLRPIPPMIQDPLSQLEFGESREKNRIFAVSPADPAAESMITIVSLRSDDQVEVRLLRGGAVDAEGAAVSEGRRPIFGVFPLARQDGECGF